MLRFVQLFCLLIICLVSSNPAFAQKKDTTIIRPIRPVNKSSPLLSSYEAPANQLKLLPPNVASAEQYGNLPINYSTGQLNYSLPLHSISVDNALSIPIQLSYNNTGLKPEQIPTWVGNGWDLSVGGSIVQYVKGNDDFSGNGLQFGGNRQRLQDYFSGSLSNTDKYFYSKGVDNGELDSQFDIFSVNILGRTAKFYFEGNNVVFFNVQPWKVSFADGQFTITDERGTKYAFATSVGSSGSFSDGFYYGNTDPFLIGTKTWYLSGITTPSGVTVSFSYSFDIQYEINANHASYSRGAFVDNTGNCSFRAGFAYAGQSSNLTVGQYVLSEIAWKGKKVTFETTARNDLQDPNGNKAKALSAIKVYDESSTVVKQIGFDYGYLNASTNDRLQLNAVSVLDNSTGGEVQTFAFDYHGLPQNSSLSVPIPSLKVPGGFNAVNHSVDHWGYFNGKANASKIPRARYPYPTASSNTTLFGDADRASDGDFSRLGMLKRITYPTKGYTDIQYEPNVVNFNTQNQTPFFLQEQYAANYTPFFDSGIRTCGNGPLTGQLTASQYISGARIKWRLATDSPDDVSRFTLTSDNYGTLVQDYAQSLKTGEVLTDLPTGTYSYTLYPGCVSQSGSANAEASFTVETPVSPAGGIPLAVGGNRVAKIVDYDPVTGSNERTITYQDANLRDEPYYISTIETGAGYGGTLNPCVSCGTTYIVGENNVYSWDGFHVEYIRAVGVTPTATMMIGY